MRGKNEFCHLISIDTLKLGFKRMKKINKKNLRLFFDSLQVGYLPKLLACLKKEMNTSNMDYRLLYQLDSTNLNALTFF